MESAQWRPCTGAGAAWAAAHRAAEAVAPAEVWRTALAERLHAAIGGHHVAVHTCTPGRMGQGRVAVSPASALDAHRRILGDVLPRLVRFGDRGAPRRERSGVVAPIVDALSGLPLAARLRAGWLAEAGVRGVLGAPLVTPEDDLVGFLEIGTTRPEMAVSAEIARPLREVAVRAAHTLGEVFALAESWGAPWEDAAPAGEGLSVREQEIAALVSEGLSDLNIAARLSITEATVGSHLRRIYKRLGVHSRVELARRARGGQEG